MRRSVGVTVIAILSLAGSGLVLLLAVLMAFAIAFASSSPSEPAIPAGFLKAILALVLVMYLAAAAWGIATGIGLLMLRAWARISILVFSVLLALMSGFSGLMALVTPFPTPSGADPSLMTVMRFGMGTFWLGLLAIGVWWLVFFTRAKVKQQFVSSGSTLPAPAPQIFAAQPPQVLPIRPPRPLSLTILAWFLLIGCLFLPFSMALHVPAFLFTKVVTGRPAELYYVAVLCLQLYIGIGLLRLKPLARSVAVGYYVFFLVSAVTFYLAPGRQARIHKLFDWEFTVFPWMRTWQSQWETQFNYMPSFIVGSCAGLVILVVVLYFLITRKQAFEKAAAGASSIAA